MTGKILRLGDRVEFFYSGKKYVGTVKKIRKNSGRILVEFINDRGKKDEVWKRATSKEIKPLDYSRPLGDYNE